MTQRNLVALVLAIAFSAAGARAQSAEPTVPAERRAYVASRIYAAIQMQFAHWEGVPDLDLEAEFKAYLGQAMATESRLNFDLATLEFIAKLRNGHSWFSDRWLSREHGQPLGFAANYMDGRWVVVRSRVEGLKPGTVIEAIDGVPAEEFFQQKKKYITGSDERAVRKNLFFRPFLFPRQFLLTLEGGQQVRIERKSLPAGMPETQTEGRWLEPRRVAYIKVPSFNDARFQKRAMELVEEYRDAATLVIDVRGNGGGSTPGDLTAALMDRPYRWWAESTPLHIGLLRYYAESGSARYPVLQRAHLSWPPEMVKPEKKLSHKLSQQDSDAG